MNLRIVAMAVALTFGGGRIVLAHEGHDQPAARPEITEEAAKGRASEELKRLVSIKKVEASWGEVKLRSIEKKTSKGQWEWLAVFENGGAAKDKLLYVFLKPSGEFVAANFTGK